MASSIEQHAERTLAMPVGRVAGAMVLAMLVGAGLCWGFGVALGWPTQAVLMATGAVGVGVVGGLAAMAAAGSRPIHQAAMVVVGASMVRMLAALVAGLGVSFSTGIGADETGKIAFWMSFLLLALLALGAEVFVALSVLREATSETTVTDTKAEGGA